jgi:hypothetical protein
MNRVKRPYRTNDPRLPIGNGPQALGFVQTMRGKLSELKRDAQGLLDRLRYKYSDGVPACYIGEKVFIPETETVQIKRGRVGFPPYTAAPDTLMDVNYVVRDSIDHTVPISMQAPGVFVARYIHVEFYQRLHGTVTAPTTGGLVVNGNDYANKEMWFQIPWGRNYYNPGMEIPLQTGKVHLLRLNELMSWAGDRSNIGINLFWNLIDRDSERRLSDEPISGATLLPQGFQNTMDGDLHEFKVPWLFERAGQVDFQFRLINPILQLAASEGPDAVCVLGNADQNTVRWDDRENNGLLRNQAVRVRVELHGTKFYTPRDALLREAS